MTRPTYRLSILDQCPLRRGCSRSEAVREALELASLADECGYHRYWLAEHHGTPPVVGVAPEVLIGPIALATKRIRVGSGGIMLPNHMPYKVAETFSLLSCLAPNRIDLGLGRAPGGNQIVADALQPDKQRFHPNDFYRAFDELLRFLEPAPTDEPSVAMLQAALPRDEGFGPDIWVLGCSEQSASWAAEKGLPYCFADFINPGPIASVEAYRKQFRSRAPGSRPNLMIASWVVVAETNAEANRQAAPLRKMMSRTAAANVATVPSLEDALAWQSALASEPVYPEHLIVGSPRDVRRSLDEFASRWGADEVMIVNMLACHQTRLDGYRRLAEEFNLARC